MPNVLERLFNTKPTQSSPKEELEYEDLLKVEFLDMLTKFQMDRTLFHIYAIDRCATTATLIGFSYEYELAEIDNEQYIIKTINLGEYGELVFKLQPGDSYGEITTKNRNQIINNLRETFPTQTKLINLSDPTN